jgi:hypothetical protein
MERETTNRKLENGCVLMLCALVATLIGAAPADAQHKPNILLIVSDDTGYADLGPYGGGEGRGMPTPNIEQLMKTYVQYPPRKLQSEVYTGPITITEYQRFQYVRDQLEMGGVSLPLPAGN